MAAPHRPRHPIHSVTDIARAAEAQVSGKSKSQISSPPFTNIAITALSITKVATHPTAR